MQYDEKSNRQYYLSRGRCPRCGGANPVAEGRRACAECMGRQKARYDANVAKWRASGLCTRCGGERDDERWKLCQACRTFCAGKNRHNAENAKARREALKAKGFCEQCGKTWAEPGRVRCKKCLAKNRAAGRSERSRMLNIERRNMRREAGQCIDCGAPTEGKTRCTRCLERQVDSNRIYRIRQRTKKMGVIL